MTTQAEEQEETPRTALLEGSVAGALREMSVPMLLGMVAMILVNLIDTYWVSRLGTSALAAMSFTFPVAAFVINVSLGILVGTSVAVSRAVGERISRFRVCDGDWVHFCRRAPAPAPR